VNDNIDKRWIYAYCGDPDVANCPPGTMRLKQKDLDEIAANSNEKRTEPVTCTKLACGEREKLVITATEE